MTQMNLTVREKQADGFAKPGLWLPRRRAKGGAGWELGLADTQTITYRMETQGPAVEESKPQSISCDKS